MLGFVECKWCAISWHFWRKTNSHQQYFREFVFDVFEWKKRRIFFRNRNGFLKMRILFRILWKNVFTEKRTERQNNENSFDKMNYSALLNLRPSLRVFNQSLKSKCFWNNLKKGNYDQGCYWYAFQWDYTKLSRCASCVSRCIPPCD